MAVNLPDEYYKYIFENSTDAIMITNPDGRVYRANPAACSMLGRSEDEIIGLGRCGVADMKDPRLDYALAEREEEGHVAAELNFKRRDGSIFPVYVTSSIFYDDQGRRGTVIIARDITEIKRTEQALRAASRKAMEMSREDYLTGVLNRRGFVERLEEEVQRSNRMNKSFGLLMMDLDMFKNVNDEFGHSVGDVLLKKVATTIKCGLRPYDILGRHGGDEFIICLPETEMGETVAVAERLRKAIEDITIDHRGKEIGITGSFGVVQYIPDSGSTPDSLISLADNNMYKAKRRRNSIFFME